VTDAEIRAAVLRQLGEIAPEADPEAIRDDADLRDQLDLDSMDMLNLVVAVDHELGVPIPESDYGLLATLNDMVAYLAARLPDDGR
jgi:acyl carrier protein